MAYHFGFDFMGEILLVGGVFEEGSIYLYNLSFKMIHPSQAYYGLQEVYVLAMVRLKLSLGEFFTRELDFLVFVSTSQSTFP